MGTALVALGIAGLLLMGCPPQEVAPFPDAYTEPVDAYMVRPDAGPPPPVTCTGAAPDCRTLMSTECTDVAGCRLSRCSGNSSCYLLDRESCSYVRGCYYSDRDGCQGDPATCETFTDGTTCRLARCNWDYDGRGRCLGSATSCSVLSGAACSAQPGCTSLLDAGMPDAGLPDATLPDAGADAGPPDAGPPMLCAVEGRCDPVVTTSCTSTQVCISSSIGTYCATQTARLTEGMPCSLRGDCRPGLVCTDGRGGRACMRPCRAGRLDCGAGSICGAALQPLQPCLRQCMQTCDLYANDCPSGEVCRHFSPARGEPAVNGCINPGFSAIGEGCTATGCMRGAICIDSVCQQICRTTADCTAGTCVPSSEGITHCE